MNKLYIGFSASTGSIPLKLLGWTIRKFTGGEVNHTFLLYFDDDWQTWVTIGANLNGITMIPLNQFIPYHDIKYIFEPQFDLWEGARTLSGDIDKKYNYFGLFGMSFVKIAQKFGNKNPHNFLSNGKDEFCSEWIAQIIDVALLYVPHHVLWTLEYTSTDIIDPTYLCNNMKLNPTLFKEVQNLFSKNTIS